MKDDPDPPTLDARLGLALDFLWALHDISFRTGDLDGRKQGRRGTPKNRDGRRYNGARPKHSPFRVSRDPCRTRGSGGWTGGVRCRATCLDTTYFTPPFLATPVRPEQLTTVFSSVVFPLTVHSQNVKFLPPHLFIP